MVFVKFKKLYESIQENGLFLFLFCILAIAPFILHLQGGIGVDEGFYLFKGYSILDGSLQNIDYWKIGATPATYFVLGGIFWLFGKTYVIPRVLLFILNIVSAILVYKIGKTCWNHSIGKISSILFLIAMVMPTFEMMYFFIEPLIIPICLIALYLFIKQQNNWNLLVIGLLIGVATLFKTVALLFFCGLAGYYIIDWIFYNNRKISIIKTASAHLFIIIIGICIPIFISFCYFWSMGNVNYFLSGGMNVVISRGWGFDITNFHHAFFAFIVLWVFLLVSIIFFIRNALADNHDKYTLLCILMLICFCVPLVSRQYGHYFTLILPYACLLAALSFEKLKYPVTLKVKNTNIDCRIFILIIIMLLILPSFNFFLQCQQYNQKDRADLLNDQLDTSQYLIAHTTLNDKILVFGYEPSIYFLTKREPATNILIFDFSRRNSRFMSENEVIDIIKSSHPYIIVRSGEIDNEYYKDTSEYIKQNYHIVETKGRFDIYF